MSFTVYPSVDIADGRCVRPLQGRFGAETVYSDDPVEVALGFGRAGARWLHIVDLEGALTGVPANRELVLDVVRKSSCPVQAGGGLRSMDDVREMLAAGANRAVLGTIALQDEAELRRACAKFGERIVVSLDARRNDSGSPNRTVGGDVPLIEAVKLFDSAGASMFIYTGMDRDGSMSGPDLDGVRAVLAETGRPVIASGGVASLEDVGRIARMRTEGVEGTIVGRALYEAKFTLSEAQLLGDTMASGRER
jgi:phosphoribosylformimino-5-aminoimidazole carboxamide ribotide isomerase